MNHSDPPKSKSPPPSKNVLKLTLALTLPGVHLQLRLIFFSALGAGAPLGYAYARDLNYVHSRSAIHFQ